MTTLKYPVENFYLAELKLGPCAYGCLILKYMDKCFSITHDCAIEEEQIKFLRPLTDYVQPKTDFLNSHLASELANQVFDQFLEDYYNHTKYSADSINI